MIIPELIKKEQNYGVWQISKNLTLINIKTGTSMANTLNIASEIDAYTISDKGTGYLLKIKII